MKLIAIGIALTLSDAGLTYLWLHAGIAREGNPMLRMLMDVLGVGTTLTLRTALGVSLLLALYALREHSPLARPATVVAVLALGLVNAWHIYNAVKIMPL